MNQNLPLRYALSEPPPMGIANQNPSLETANENPSERQPIRTPLRDSQSEPAWRYLRSSWSVNRRHWVSLRLRTGKRTIGEMGVRWGRMLWSHRSVLLFILGPLLLLPLPLLLPTKVSVHTPSTLRLSWSAQSKGLSCSPMVWVKVRVSLLSHHRLLRVRVLSVLWDLVRVRVRVS